MFDWFKGKTAKEYLDNAKSDSNVVPFPEPKEHPKMPYVVPPTPEPEKPAMVFYRFGITDKNRLAFQMGYSELTMNKEGVERLIEQLEFFKGQLQDESEEV